MFKPEIIVPTVELMDMTPLYVGEVAARGCYDSFSSSEHDSIINFNSSNELDTETLEEIKNSKLLYKLSHVFHHGSVLEHINLDFKINDVGHGVMQELIRHRFATITTLDDDKTTRMMKAFIESRIKLDNNIFIDWLIDNKYFNYKNKDNIILSSKHLVRKIELLNIKDSDIKRAGKGLDPIKFTVSELSGLITDNVSISFHMGINLRTLKDMLKLRDSGAAYYQIIAMAKEIKKSLPYGYLELVTTKKERKDTEQTLGGLNER